MLAATHVLKHIEDLQQAPNLKLKLFRIKPDLLGIKLLLGFPSILMVGCGLLLMVSEIRMVFVQGRVTMMIL